MKSIPTTLVHVTHKKNVEAILKHGLMPNKTRTTAGGAPEGRVYLALDADVLTDDTSDGRFFSGPDAVVLNVDTTTLRDRLRPDPEWRSEDHHNPEHFDDDMCWYVEGSICPTLVSVAPVTPKGNTTLNDRVAFTLTPEGLKAATVLALAEQKAFSLRQPRTFTLNENELVFWEFVNFFGSLMCHGSDVLFSSITITKRDS